MPRPRKNPLENLYHMKGKVRKNKRAMTRAGEFAPEGYLPGNLVQTPDTPRTVGLDAFDYALGSEGAMDAMALHILRARPAGGMIHFDLESAFGQEEGRVHRTTANPTSQRTGRFSGPVTAQEIERAIRDGLQQANRNERVRNPPRVYLDTEMTEAQVAQRLDFMRRAAERESSSLARSLGGLRMSLNSAIQGAAANLMTAGRAMGVTAQQAAENLRNVGMGLQANGPSARAALESLDYSALEQRVQASTLTVGGRMTGRNTINIDSLAELSSRSTPEQQEIARQIAERLDQGILDALRSPHGQEHITGILRGRTSVSSPQVQQVAKLKPHPDAGKPVASARLLRRTVGGVKVENIRQSDGSIAQRKADKGDV